MDKENYSDAVFVVYGQQNATEAAAVLCWLFHVNTK